MKPAAIRRRQRSGKDDAWCRTSYQQFLQHALRLDAGQALIESLELEREAFVVDAQAVQNGGVQVVHVDRLVDHVVAEVVGLAVDLPSFDSAAGHPHGKAA